VIGKALLTLLPSSLLLFLSAILDKGKAGVYFEEGGGREPETKDKEIEQWQR